MVVFVVLKVIVLILVAITLQFRSIVFVINCPRRCIIYVPMKMASSIVVQATGLIWENFLIMLNFRKIYNPGYKLKVICIILSL